MKTLDDIEREPQFTTLVCGAIANDVSIILGVQVQGNEFSFELLTKALFEQSVHSNRAIAAHKAELRSHFPRLTGPNILIALLPEDLSSVEARVYGKMFFASMLSSGPDDLFGMASLLRNPTVIGAIQDIVDREGPQFICVQPTAEGMRVIDIEIKEARYLCTSELQTPNESRDLFLEALSRLTPESIMVTSFFPSEMDWAVVQKSEYQTGPQWEARQKRIRKQKRNLRNQKRQEGGQNGEVE